MSSFVAIAAVLTLAVLAVLLRPLWRDARRLAAGIGAVVVVGAVALYEIVGTPAALDPQARAAPHLPVRTAQPARPCCSSAIRFFATLLLKSEQQSMRMYVDHSSIAFCVSPLPS